VRLEQWPTEIKPFFKSEEAVQARLAPMVSKTLSALQRLLYASRRYAILCVFQAMDTAGRTVRSPRLTGITGGCDVSVQATERRGVAHDSSGARRPSAGP